MRSLLIRLFFLMALCWSLGAPAALAKGTSTGQSLSIHGESAILIDAATGQVLFEKNPHARLYPASITKIATGIYAIENGNPDDIVTVSKKARYEEGTRVYLAEGEQVTLRKLEYGLLMHSGNDAATAIAEHLSGTTEQFAAELTRFVREKIGVQDTNFTNAHGLHDPNHYTTAYDMAKISQYAMKNPTFREIVGTNRLPWDGLEWKSELVNHNKLIRNYEGATGIKNGFTDQAMHTLVGSAKRGETELIAVTMKAPSSAMAYKDVTAMLDYGFAHFETKQVASAGETFTRPATREGETASRFAVKEDLYATVPIGTNPYITVTANGQLTVVAGPLTISYPLERLNPPAEVKAAADSAATPDGQAERAYDTVTVRYALLLVWLTFNLFLIACLVFRLRRQKRVRRREM